MLELPCDFGSLGIMTFRDLAEVTVECYVILPTEDVEGNPVQLFGKEVGDSNDFPKLIVLWTLGNCSYPFTG